MLMNETGNLEPDGVKNQSPATKTCAMSGGGRRMGIN
jgi:hypothetical protein